MAHKRNEFGDPENRTPGDRRSGCMAVDAKLCDEKHSYMERIINHRFESMDASVVAKSIDLERRLEGLNDLRAQVIRDRDQFVKKETYDLRVQHYDKYIEGAYITHQALMNRLTVIETRSVVWTSVIGVAFTVLQVLLHFFPRG
jgi:hypothetical protein